MRGVASPTTQRHTGSPPPRTELHPVTLGLASTASVVATVVLSRFGLAGTLLGAAVAPLILALVKELGRRPAEVIIARAPATRSAWRPPRPPTRPSGLGARLARVRWGVVAATSTVAVAVSVAVFTVPELIAGRSIVAERPSTFFSTAPSPRDDARPAATDEADDAPPARTTTTTTTTTTTPETVTEETTTPPPETTTAPPATTAAPAPAPPAPAPPPGAAAPAPEAPPAP